MKKLFIAIALFMMASTGYSQEVKREGTMFVEQSSKKEFTLKNDTKTGYTFKAKDGKTYPVYLSKNGKAFIVRTSKKTGKQYKQYLPEVTKQISK